jgi:hypothetical protein
MYGLTNLLAQLQKEFKLSSRSPKSSTEVIKGNFPTGVQDSDISHPILSPTLRPSAKARGLPLFDRSTHLVCSLCLCMSLSPSLSGTPLGNIEASCDVNSRVCLQQLEQQHWERRRRR